MRRIGGMLRLVGLVALLNGCATTLTTASGVAPDGHLMYAGTRLNSSIISQASCESGVPDNHGCAYDKVLAPLSVVDFLPSLLLDTLLLPFTALHALLQADG
ncbi:hypothetical protein GCM10007363_01290 [Pseudomonas fluvialis]|uniref:YceK/YidQ family lipoprotein n=2 Tax=Pseudomonas fluvialis TaxID=1793966 RepID=A0ABQ2ACZ2_9PSED|nr:hypothetical protein GCM10007363_01290 [Pseudomonas fluvialis]